MTKKETKHRVLCNSGLGAPHKFSPRSLKDTICDKCLQMLSRMKRCTHCNAVSDTDFCAACLPARITKHEMASGPLLPRLLEEIESILRLEAKKGAKIKAIRAIKDEFQARFDKARAKFGIVT